VWAELIKAVTLLAKGHIVGTSPFHCEHDELTVMADPAMFTPEELAQLDAWGFHPGDEGAFYSFRYGSA
jgi:hypothetical protein